MTEMVPLSAIVKDIAFKGRELGRALHSYDFPHDDPLDDQAIESIRELGANVDSSVDILSQISKDLKADESRDGLFPFPTESPLALEFAILMS